MPAMSGNARATEGSGHPGRTNPIVLPRITWIWQPRLGRKKKAASAKAAFFVRY